MNSIVAVIGDVHHQLWLAVEELSRIERNLGRAIDQVFSVGDLGLFLEEADWRFLTGPAKHRHPDDTPRIRKAWEAWRWPLSMIAGNHEPFHHLRNWNPDHFGGKLRYVDAGEMPHSIPGFRAYGLSGIFHPGELNFTNEAEKWRAKKSLRSSWPEMVEQVQKNAVSPKRLTYYKQFEIDLLLALPPNPHLLLTHDWPVKPNRLRFEYPRRPETELVNQVQPQYACCGHHHASAAFEVPPTQVRALNIISRDTSGNIINPGWCLLLEWDGMRLIERKLSP
jgi:hypothetical protein